LHHRLPCAASGFAAPGDSERCNAVFAWHIDSGEADGTDVNDLSVVLVIDVPEKTWDGNWRVGTLISDEHRLHGVRRGA
jgi:hypothetical protein